MSENDSPMFLSLSPPLQLLSTPRGIVIFIVTVLRIFAHIPIIVIIIRGVSKFSIQNIIVSIVSKVVIILISADFVGIRRLLDAVDVASRQTRRVVLIFVVEVIIVEVRGVEELIVRANFIGVCATRDHMW